MEKNCGRCKTFINSIAEEVLGIMEPANRGTWFDDECQAATEDKNKAHRKMQHGYDTRSWLEEYKEKRRKEKSIHKRKKKEWTNLELENIEMMRKHDCRKFYKEINMARKQFKPRVHIFRNEDGSLISNDNECVTFTTTSSNQILKGKTYDTTDVPTIEETETALKKLKNNKAPGIDNILAELLKFGDDRLQQCLKHKFSSIGINEEIPKEWLQGIICPLHKKGDQLECANYTGITLLNVTYKVFSNILYTRLLPHVQCKLGHYQAGFRPRKSTINQMFRLRQILEKMKEFTMSIHLLFVDFKSAIWQHW